MAQSPWCMLEDLPVSGKEAAHLAGRCARDLNRHLGQTETWNNLVTQITLFSQSIIDLSVKIRSSKPNQLDYSRSEEGKRTSGQAKSSSSKNTTTKTTNPTSFDASPIPSKYENQTFWRMRVRGTAQLHPCFLDNADKGVRAYISNFLLKYVPEFQGIWVAYHPHIIATESVGYISEAEPLAIIALQIELHCLVFRPKPGSILAGIVQSIRPTHIVLMVHGLFNACVRKPGLDRRYEFKNGRYIARDGISAKIETNSLVAFRVYQYHQSHSGEIMTIEGSTNDRNRCGVLDPDTLKLSLLKDQVPNGRSSLSESSRSKTLESRSRSPTRMKEEI